MELAIIKKMIELQVAPSKIGLTEAQFVSEDAKRAFTFVTKFFGDHGKLPAIATVDAECNTHLRITESSESLQYYLDKHLKLRQFKGIGDFIKWSINSLKQSDDTGRVIDAMRQVIKASDAVAGNKVWSIEELEDRKKVLEAYEAIKKLEGKPRGIATPWQFINDSVGGILPASFTSIISHSSVGKTWILTKIAAFAQQAGKRVLLISPEMTQDVMQFRFAAVYLNLDYNAFTKGILSPPEEARIVDFVAQPVSTSTMIIIDAAVIQTVDQVEYFAAEYKPDLVIVDSYYLLDMKGKYGGTNEKREAITIELYNQAKRTKVPYIVTTHWSSTLKQGKKGDIGDVGYTKQAIRLADLALGLHKDEEMEDAKTMLMQIIKHREGVKADVLINFDLTSMNFNQIRVENTKHEFGVLPDGGKPKTAPPDPSQTAPTAPPVTPAPDPFAQGELPVDLPNPADIPEPPEDMPF